jgi:ribokinase
LARILVSGSINIETTLKIDGFPYEYAPVRYPFFGVQSSVSGVGYNITSALTTLGHEVNLLSLIGDDHAGAQVRLALKELGVDDAYILPQLSQTLQAVILYDSDGRRAINADLKDVQEQTYPVQNFEQALSKSDLAVLCNINFSRPMLERAKAAGVPVATDVHAVSDLHSDYDADFMRHADILFQSHENLPVPPREWIYRLWETYHTPIAVTGMGADGALLGVLADSQIVHVPAVQTRPVINTIGAGDSLFSAFLHGYVQHRDPYAALKQAVVFASWKIGEVGAAAGFLNAGELTAKANEVYTRL